MAPGAETEDVSDMRMRRAVVAGSVVVALAAGAAGCGGDEGEPAATTAAPSSVSTPSTVALPADWPADVPLPEGAKVLEAGETDGTWSLTARVPGDFQPVYDESRALLVGRGYAIGEEQKGEGRLQFGWAASLVATNAEHEVRLHVEEADDYADTDDLSVNYYVAPAS